MSSKTLKTLDAVALERRIADLIVKERLLDEGDYVVAVSGGPDSVALALLVKIYAEEQHLSGRMHIAHLNHKLRGKAAEADAAFVRRLAQRLDATFHLEEQNIRALAADRGVGIEEAARIARYDFLERVAHSVGAKRVLLGHTASDNVETILHRILRGTGLTGLAGIPLRRFIRPGSDVEVVRPLLFTTRQEVLAYLRQRRVRYRQDATNLSLGYTRNRIRHELIPLLESRFNPQVQQALLRLAHTAEAEHAFVMTEVERWLNKARPKVEHGVLRVEIRPLRKMPVLLRPLAIRELVERLGVGLQPFTMEHYERVAGLIAATATGRQIRLPQGVVACVSGRQLILTCPWAQETEWEINLPVPGEAWLPDGRLVRAQILEGTLQSQRKFFTAKTPWEERLDADKVVLPLSIAPPRQGECFHPLGATGSKKVMEFFADAGVSRIDRTHWPIVRDKQGPIWITGMRIADRVKLTTRTRRILELILETEPVP